MVNSKLARAIEDVRRAMLFQAGSCLSEKDFSTNAALADEMLKGKRVKVRGKVLQITRSIAKESVVSYVLEMGGENSSLPAPGVAQLAGGRLSFLFSALRRGELAQLRPGQLVVIEGEAGDFVAVNRGYGNGAYGEVTFSECKIIEVEKLVK